MRSLSAYIEPSQNQFDDFKSKTPDHLKDSLGESYLVLTSDDLQALEEVTNLPPEYSGWMLAMKGQFRAVPPVWA